mgnify:CR=1 FL=1
MICRCRATPFRCRTRRGAERLASRLCSSRSSKFGVIVAPAMPVRRAASIKVVIANRRDALSCSPAASRLRPVKQAKLIALLQRAAREGCKGWTPTTFQAFAGDFVRAKRGGSLDRARDWLRQAQRRPARAVGARRRGDPPRTYSRIPTFVAVVEGPGGRPGSTTPSVAAVTDAGVQPVCSIRVDTDDHSFVTNGSSATTPRPGSLRLPWTMLRDIDEDTVDFRDNYDGQVRRARRCCPAGSRTCWSTGRRGIAVGMATKIPPHNLREVASGVQWYLDNFDADPTRPARAALIERIKGPTSHQRA